MADKNLRKNFMLWLASFLTAAIILFFYFKAPLLPIILAGAGTLALVIYRSRTKK